jgi:hypothetical protein
LLLASIVGWGLLGAPAVALASAVRIEASARDDSPAAGDVVVRPGAMRLSDALPLKRDGVAGKDAGWTWARGFSVVVTLAILVGTVFLRWRRRSSAAARTERGCSAWPSWLRPTQTGRSLRLLQSARLTARASVHVLQWNGREWLVGCSEQGIAMLGSGAVPTDERRQAAPDIGFATDAEEGPVSASLSAIRRGEQG